MKKKVVKKIVKKVLKKAPVPKYLELSAVDFRTLLAVVNNLLMDIEIPEEHREASEAIQLECHRIVNLINDAIGVETKTGDDNGTESEE